MDDQPLWVQIASFVEAGDRDWTQAFMRYLTWEERERERLRNPAAHIINRFDLSAMPFPVSLQVVDVFDYGGYPGSHMIIRLRIRACLPNRRDSEKRYDFEIDRRMWADSEALCIDFICNTIRRFVSDFVRMAVVVKPKDG
jgi:hypothetical protein